jgi:predicted permease
MNWIARLFDKRKDDLGDELEAHLQMDVADRINRGERPEQARLEAKRALGNVALVQDVTHDFWGWTHLETVFNDLQISLRMLRRSPGYALTVILTLAIGVGATCGMFTVVDHVLLRSLPFWEPERLVDIAETGRLGSDQLGKVALPDIVEWQQRSRSFEALSFYIQHDDRTSFLENGNETVQVSTPMVSANLFPMLGLKPALGRGFLTEGPDGLAKPEDSKTMLLSDASWRVAFGGRPNVIGTVAHINGEALTIIGIMPPRVVFPYGSGHWNGLPVVWRPIVSGEAVMTRAHNVERYRVVARIKEQTSFATAQQELRAIEEDVAKAYTDPFDRDHVTSVNLEGYAHSLVGADVRKATLSLFGASALLWLIACVNAAALVFARSAARQREFAVRGALGASRARILQQMLIEGAVISMSSSLLGLALAFAMLKSFEHGLVTKFNIHQKLQPDLRMTAGLILLTVCGAVVVALWPAFGVLANTLENRLRQGAPQAGTSRSQHRIRAALVVTQISLALTLLVGCGLLLRTIYALRHVALGFRTEHIIVANMTIPSYRYARRNMTTDLYQPLIDRVKGLPGVTSAALMTEVPLGHTFSMMFTLGPSGNSAIELRRRELKAQFRAVGPEMQNVFGFQMARGRFFSDQDTATSPAVVIVNRAFVRAYFGDDRDPSAILGESLMGFSKTRRSTVVGVLDDERQVSVTEPSQPEIEVSIPQITPDSMFYKAAEGMAMDVAVRTTTNPAQIISELRRVLRDASPYLASSSFSMMDEIVDDSFGSQKLASELLTIFAGSALLLALGGIYGMLAYWVVQRKQEIGVRIALGAQRFHIRRLILRQAYWLIGAGVLLGTGLSYLFTQWLKVFLFEVNPNDPWTGLIAASLLSLGGIFAALIPARRAAAADPVDMIRAE